ncbi:carboxylate-amine ligase [Streptomyces sp. CA-132043]|uniref:carboxylate-amine ligase n=1 Tax=Streptomyces sp. CA-132043 TaxID=3240048 RepID=UPI003D8FA56F
MPAAASGPGRAGRGGGRLTVGAEEEYLLVDPVSRALSPAAEKVVAEAGSELGDRVTTEVTRYQVEVRTDPHTRLADFADQVRSMRRTVARAAARHGLSVISTGTPVLAHPMPPPLTEGRRYAESAARFGALDDEQSVCASHFHVGVPDVETALHVSNHLRPWLPTLIALAANSPYWQGHDTGHASWRTVTWARWPAAGPPPYFASRAHFEDLIADLTATGAVMDRGGLYWDIRPSHHLPTLEVRVADAVCTAQDTLLLAAVVRALVATALADIEAGTPPFRPQPEMLRSACWRAAHDGLAGSGVDLHTRRLVPAALLIEHLLKRLAPALQRHGDLDSVRTGWARLRADGNGADRQRAAYRTRRSLTDVIDHLVNALQQ